MLQLRLDFADGVHHFIKLFGRSIAHFIVQLQHLLLHSVHAVESSTQNFADGHALFQSALLVQITDGNLTGPFNLAFVRQYVTGYDIQKGGFAFAVCADKTDVLTAQELKGNVF